eukprot:Sdes_comp20013_c0_seq1m12698
MEHHENLSLETEIMQWIQETIGEPLVGDSSYLKLKDGVALCKLINVLKPNSVGKIYNGNMPFKQMENIANFLLVAADAFGVPSNELFQTVDLFENHNLQQVFVCILSLNRQARKHGYSGALIGPKMSDKNIRNFSQDVLNSGKFSSSQQMGNNKGATQAGMTVYGKTREIVPKNLSNFILKSRICHHLASLLFIQNSPFNLRSSLFVSCIILAASFPDRTAT